MSSALPNPTIAGASTRVEARLTPAQQAEMLAALRASPGPYEPLWKRVTRRLADMGFLTDQDGGRYRLTAAGRELASQLFAARVITAANARRLANVKVKAAAGVPLEWPFPESHHAW